MNLNFITLLQLFFYNFFSWKFSIKVSPQYRLFSYSLDTVSSEASEKERNKEMIACTCVILCVCVCLCIVTEHSISYYIWALQLGSASRRPSSMICVFSRAKLACVHPVFGFCIYSVMILYKCLTMFFTNIMWI